MIKPQLCHTLKGSELPGAGWIMEPKLDGWRWLLVRTTDGVESYGGRNGARHNAPGVEQAAMTLPPGTILDGEIIADGAGAHSGDVSTALARRWPLTFVAFDILELAGEDVTSRPWHERRALLEALPVHAAPLTLNPYSPVPDRALYERWIELGCEGAVLKRRDSIYRKGARSRDWLKLKHTATADAIITGFAKGSGKLAGKVGALRLQLLDSGVTTTCSAMGLGIDGNEQAWLGRTCEIKHYGIFAGGRPRHPIFNRLRPDLEQAA